jgi:hypothetical protein
MFYLNIHIYVLCNVIWWILCTHCKWRWTMLIVKYFNFLYLSTWWLKKYFTNYVAGWIVCPCLIRLTCNNGIAWQIIASITRYLSYCSISSVSSVTLSIWRSWVLTIWSLCANQLSMHQKRENFCIELKLDCFNALLKGLIFRIHLLNRDTTALKYVQVRSVSPFIEESWKCKIPSKPPEFGEQ